MTGNSTDVIDIFVTMDHIRIAGGCAPGAKTWFRRYGLDFRAFIRDGGISSDKLLATGDALALRTVAIALKSNSNGA
ncbi:hypothetical protein BIY29_10245 [Brenneria alni]|uniref:Uncharacterized protein n=1 Tax=Brenneria alni TaxID=71656 RepID=A0A421DNN3_9GAMM|nr:hypothetical protein [Brenneria alni]RLM23671.1 hypothetical protein BIY29_10245 [Brenneria alni]